MLHNGQSISDELKEYDATDKIEWQANTFARELLYPNSFFMEDYKYISSNNLLNIEQRKKLGIYVDELCHKYCLSYQAVLQGILYKGNKTQCYKTIKNEIENSLGSKISTYFEKDFYIPNPKLKQYQQYETPYKNLENILNTLVEGKKIGIATAEAIKLRNGIKIE